MRLILGSALLLCLLSSAIPAEPAASEAIRPTQTIPLFNGKDFTGLTTWLRDTKREDPRKVFQFEDGMLHISGDGFGYVATDKAYKDYRVSVEYKWGKRTDGGKYVRNSGVLLHATGPDGGSGKGAWMSCFECQLAQGCAGDIIVIRGKDEKDQTIPVKMTSDVVLGPDKKPRWTEKGTPTTFTGRQLWWKNHDPDFKELLDTRGKNDVESPLGDWTKVECTCSGSEITIAINDTIVNKCYNAFPAAGKILLQSEGFEIYFRKFELHPITPMEPRTK
jgi:hypothetical protein